MAELGGVPTNGDTVRFSIKDLFNAIDHKLDRIDSKLETKANQTLVNELSQKVTLVAAMIPQNLLEEHKQVIIDTALNKQKITEFEAKNGQRSYLWSALAGAITGSVLSAVVTFTLTHLAPISTAATAASTGH